MSDSIDPSRIVERGSRASSALRLLVHAAKTECPSPERLASLASRLSELINPPTAATSVRATASLQPPAGVIPSVANRTWWLIAGGSVVALAVAVGGLGAWRHSHVHAGAPVRVAETAASALPKLSYDHAPTHVVARSPAATVSEPPRSARIAVPRVVARGPTADPATESHVPTTPVSAGSSVTTPAAPLANDADAETRVLDRAIVALRSHADPSIALTAVDEHAHRFPDGLLSQEREAIAIEALLALGHRDAAVTRAEEFRARYPSSAQLRRIEALLGATH